MLALPIGRTGRVEYNTYLEYVALSFVTLLFG